MLVTIQDASTALSSLNFIMTRVAKPDPSILGDATQANLREKLGVLSKVKPLSKSCCAMCLPSSAKSAAPRQAVDQQPGRHLC